MVVLTLLEDDDLESKGKFLSKYCLLGSMLGIKLRLYTVLAQNLVGNPVSRTNLGHIQDSFSG